MLIDVFGFLARAFVLFAPTPAPTHAPLHQPAPHIAVSIPLMGTPGVGSGSASAADAVVDSVQKFYANIKQVSATFRQTVQYSTFGTDKTSDGSVLIAKPGKMRWDYVEKRKGKVEVTKSFISNGQYLYLVEHDNKQVSKKNLQNDVMPVAISFLYGTGNLKAEFTAELDTTGKYGDAKSDVVLKLTPKQPSAQYKNLFLVVSQKDSHVSQSIIIDANNNSNHFRFFQPDFEKPIKDAMFMFDMKSVPNYRSVDLDQQQGSGAATGAPNPPPMPAVPVAPPAKK